MMTLSCSGVSSRQDWMTFLAVLFVQILAAASLAITIDRAVHSKKVQWFILTTFCGVTPVGLAIGWLCSLPDDGVLTGVLQCITAGYLLQVAVGQILPRVMSQCVPGIPGPELSHLIWMMIAGFSAAALFSTLSWAAMTGVH